MLADDMLRLLENRITVIWSWGRNVVAAPPVTSRSGGYQGAPIFTHPLHHPANATLFPAKSAQEPVESPVFLQSEQFPQYASDAPATVQLQTS